MNSEKATGYNQIPLRTEDEYEQIVAERSKHVFDVMSRRVSNNDINRLRKAFEFAKEAHKLQRRKTGAPYIIHPIAVASIAAEELRLDTDSVITAFLHDVVEDTDYTIEDIRNNFGNNVALLVDVVTKKKKEKYKMSKQVDNYQQLLDSLNYDIRALMVKLADRLHNMRTLSSMLPDKQMKIAGETDYFYAPLANRLGLFDIKTDLENLSFKYRCPADFDAIETQLQQDMANNKKRLELFCSTIEEFLRIHDIWAKAEVYYRRPYSIWRKMKTQDKDFKHIDNRYYVRITYNHCGEVLCEKDVCLKIYSILTDVYKEKPLSFVNQIDQAKENSYQSLNVMLLSEHGIWEDVQICSERMVEASKLGCMAERDESNVGEWIDRFKKVLEDIAKQSTNNFIESVVTSLYYDDVMVFTPQGEAIVLPKGATAIDFAFELHTDIGLHAHYARINGKLCSVKTELNRGDCVEIGVAEKIMAQADWFDSACTYKARRTLRNLNSTNSHSKYIRCPHCNPLPGGETIGFKDSEGGITIHRRSCSDAIQMASKYGDRIVAVDFNLEPDTTYLVAVEIKAIDRYHLLMDIIETITTKLKLSIGSVKTTTEDHIVQCHVTFYVHGVNEQAEAMKSLYEIDGIDELRYS